MAKRAIGAKATSNSTESRIAELGRAAQTNQNRAIRLALAAKADGITHPLVHHLVGIKLKQEERFDEAIAELGLGLQLDPDDAQLMATIGFCLLELGRRREAARVFGVAIKLDPNSAEISFGYGWAAERLGVLDSAESGFKRAIALNPRHADAMAGLSGLAVRRRDWGVGKAYAEQAVSIDPHQTDALMNLARIALGQNDFRGAETQLRHIIALPYLKPQARASAWMVLGDALDGAARYADAFSAYAKGKGEMGEQFARTFGGARANAAYDGVHAILSEFLETPPEAWSRSSPMAQSSDERGHAFLVGFPRSGTTLLEQVLAANPDVVALDERPVLIDAEAEFLTQDGGIKRLSGIESERLELFRQSYWRRVRDFGVEPKNKLFIDKHPLSTFRLPLMSKVFPNAKIIFALRDPRDVVLSCFRRSFNMNAAMYEFNTIEGAARYYDAVMTAGQVYFEKLPLQAFQLRYESLVADFEGTARGLCDFLGIEWNEAMKGFAATSTARRIATPSSAQVTRGLYSEGVDQWRNYEFALEPALPILAPWVERFGYAPA